MPLKIVNDGINLLSRLQPCRGSRDATILKPPAFPSMNAPVVCVEKAFGDHLQTLGRILISNTLDQPVVQSELPPVLEDLSSHISSKYPAELFGFGLDRSQWELSWDLNELMIQTTNPDRFLCNSAMREISAWLTGRKVEHWIAEILVPVAKNKAYNNFMAIACVEGKDYVFGVTPLDCAVLKTYNGGKVEDNPLFMKHLVFNRPYMREVTRDPSELRTWGVKVPLSRDYDMWCAPLEDRTLDISARAQLDGSARYLTYYASLITSRRVDLNIVPSTVASLSVKMPVEILRAVQSDLMVEDRNMAVMSKPFQYRSMLEETWDRDFFASLGDDVAQMAEFNMRTVLTELVLATPINYDLPVLDGIRDLADDPRYPEAITSIADYLKGIESLKWQLAHNMGLQDTSEDIEFLTDGLIKPPPGCYMYFPALDNIMGRSHARPTYREVQNIFDRFVFQSMPDIFWGLERALRGAGFDREKEGRLSIFVNDRRRLNPSDITLLLIERFGSVSTSSPCPGNT